MVKILCPTDFSDVALNAVSYAAKFTKAAEAELTLLYVESLVEYTNAELIRGKSMTLEAEALQLEEQCREISATFHISCYSEIQPSSSSLSNLISSRSEDFDLIIMGTNGADDFYSSFSGTNTYKVIKSASIPVLYVPPSYIYNKIETIVYAFDYLQDFKLPLEQLKYWIKKFQSKLIVLLISDSLDSKKEFELMELQRQIKNSYLDDGLVIDFDTVLDTHIAQSIMNYVAENEVDLLALCTHHYGVWEGLFHKSVIKSISNKAQFPVFNFHK